MIRFRRLKNHKEWIVKWGGLGKEARIDVFTDEDAFNRFVEHKRKAGFSIFAQTDMHINNGFKIEFFNPFW